LQSQGGTQGPALSQINEFQKNQKILIQLQKTKILAQEKVVEGKRELLLQAAVETKTINKFKEKKFNEYREEREADEQKEMDEQNILRFKPFSKRE
jgi:flagellar FliJ protein